MHYPEHRISEYQANLPRKCESQELSSSPYVGCVVICVLADGCCCCWVGVCWVGGCDVCWVCCWAWIWLLPPLVLLFESVWQSDGVPRLILLPAGDRTQRFFFVFRFCIFFKLIFVFFNLHNLIVSNRKRNGNETRTKITTRLLENIQRQFMLLFEWIKSTMCVWNDFRASVKWRFDGKNIFHAFTW